MAGISNSAKNNQTDQFIQSVRTTTEAVSALIENSAQAAYLIGISDPSSVVGKAGIIDQREVSDAINGIQDASRVITSSSPVTQQQVGVEMADFKSGGFDRGLNGSVRFGEVLVRTEDRAITI